MKYTYTLGVQNSSVQEKINSKQFELSEELMDKRFELSLNIYEMAEILAIPVNHYAKLEFGDQAIPIADYQSAIKKINNYTDEIKIDLINDLIEKALSKRENPENINKFYSYKKKGMYSNKQMAFNTNYIKMSQVAEAA